MSDEFGTTNVRRGERAREIEVLRQHYRQHRDALARMSADAPTEQLASEYQRLLVMVDRSLGKLDELDGGALAAPPSPPMAPPPQQQRPTVAQQRSAASPSPADDPTLNLETEPGLRPLMTAPGAEPHDEYTEADGGDRSRVPLIVAAAIVVLALIGWLIWRASSDRAPERPVVEDTTATEPVAPDTAAEPPVSAVASGLTATPPSQEYGTIRKGTRATRQFEIANNTDEPISLQVARSVCRCLYYEHAPVIPPKAKESLTVTIDGARAKSGDLHETLKLTAKSDPSVTTSIDVIATVR